MGLSLTGCSKPHFSQKLDPEVLERMPVVQSLPAVLAEVPTTIASAVVHSLRGTFT